VYEILENPAKPRSYRLGFLQGYLPPTDREGVFSKGSPAPLRGMIKM
jgi:hypothetical protein